MAIGREEIGCRERGRGEGEGGGRGGRESGRERGGRGREERERGGGSEEGAIIWLVELTFKITPMYVVVKCIVHVCNAV